MRKVEGLNEPLRLWIILIGRKRVCIGFPLKPPRGGKDYSNDRSQSEHSDPNVRPGDPIKSESRSSKSLTRFVRLNDSHSMPAITVTDILGRHQRFTKCRSSGHLARPTCSLSELTRGNLAAGT